MRLVDADKLIRQLIETEGDPGDVHKYCYPCKEILELIGKQPTIEPRPRWIPVSERLPEDKGRYLVCYTLCGTVRDIRTAMFYPGGWLEWDVDGTRGIARVVAWMPLPEAYEEDK